MLCSERLALQGFDPKLAEHFESECLCRKAAGNAYPAPLVGMVLGPMLDKIALWEKRHPGAMLPSAVVSPAFLKSVGKIPRQILAAKVAGGRANAKARASFKSKRKAAFSSDSD